MKTFKITISDHVRPLKSLVIVIIVFSIGMYFLMIYKKGYFELNTALLVGGITFLIYVFPMFILHMQYYFINRNDIFKNDKSSGKMVFQSGGKQTCFELNDIQKIIVFKSRPLAENRTPIFAWDEYNYAVIELKDGQIIKLSSLLVNELDKVVKFDNTEIKKTLYAWMS